MAFLDIKDAFTEKARHSEVRLKLVSAVSLNQGHDVSLPP